MNQDKRMIIKPLGFPWKTQDPFIFCAHHRDLYPKGNMSMGPDKSLIGRNLGNDFTIKDGWRMYHGQSIPGFPSHPHRGFETITIVKEGIIDHTDSLGAAGRFGAGDVQWMTAGKGVQHAEMFPLIHQDKENHLELFQVWLNLPKSKKFVEPHFKMLWEDHIPLLKEFDENGNVTEINLIAGSLNQIQAPNPTPDSWAADVENEVLIITVRLKPHAKWTLPEASMGTNRTLYFYQGAGLKMESELIPPYHSIQVKDNGNCFFEAGEQECFILLLQGKPISEPVVQYGPFVMNSEIEIDRKSVV